MEYNVDPSGEGLNYADNTACVSAYLRKAVYSLRPRSTLRFVLELRMSSAHARQRHGRNPLV